MRASTPIPGASSGQVVAARDALRRLRADERATRRAGVRRVAPAGAGELAVAIRDITPSSFERVALIRDWLDDLGVDRVTLSVVPAADLHPIQDRSEPLVAWLAERRLAGDAIAQQGLRNRCSRRPGRGLRGRCDPAAEFACLDAEETRRAVEAGWRILRLAGLEPGGFVAPGDALTPALHAALPRRFPWWAGARRLFRAGGPREGLVLDGDVLRLDLSAGQLASRRNVVATERLLGDARGRSAVTLAEVSDRSGGRGPSPSTCSA